MKRSLLYPAPLALAALLAGCAQDATTPISPSDAVFARPGGSTQVPLKVVWSSASQGIGNDIGVLGANSSAGGSDTYVKGECGVGAHTWTGEGNNGWFDTQPTNYKDTNPSCLRWLTFTGSGITGTRLEGDPGDTEVRVWDMTSVTIATGPQERRVGMGIQTDAVRDKLGCQILVYDKDAYSKPYEVTSATVTRLQDGPSGERQWSVQATTAECEITDPKTGKRSTRGPVTFPFYFIMQEK